MARRTRPRAGLPAGPEMVLALSAAMAVLAGCSQRRAAADPNHVVYAIPDDFRLSMLRFQRRLEAHDIEGTLRSFDPAGFPHFRDFERRFLAFSRRAADLRFEWSIRDVTEKDGCRVFEVPWCLKFTDVLHGHPVTRRGTTGFVWSHHVVPRIIGLTGADPFAAP